MKVSQPIRVVLPCAFFLLSYLFTFFFSFCWCSQQTLTLGWQIASIRQRNRLNSGRYLYENFCTQAKFALRFLPTFLISGFEIFAAIKRNSLFFFTSNTNIQHLCVDIKKSHRRKRQKIVHKNRIKAYNLYFFTAILVRVN